MSSVVINLPESTRVFLLEDSDDRIRWFQQRVKNLTVAKTADEARNILVGTSASEFDFMFLDHDLGLLDYRGVKRDEGNGQEVARLLAHAQYPSNRVVVHSWNAWGAGKMKEVLGVGAKVIPFGQFRLNMN